MANQTRKTSELAVRSLAVACFAVLGWAIVDSVRLARAASTASAAQNNSQASPNSVALVSPAGHWSFEGITLNAHSGEFAASFEMDSDFEPRLAEMPRGARRAAARLSREGAVLLEVVSLPEIASAKSLIAKWEAAGWNVQPNSVRRLGEFGYFLSRGDSLRYAWSANPLEALESVLLVDRSFENN